MRLVEELKRNPLAVFRAALKYRRELKSIKILRRSNEFDARFYLFKNYDVAIAGVDPARHYLRHGVAENRDPSPDFSTAGYLARYPDVARGGQNPLIHYIKYGRSEGRSTGQASYRFAELELATFARQEEGPTPLEESPPRWTDGDPVRWPETFEIRLLQREKNLERADVTAPFPGEITFSLLTPIYKTPISYLIDLAKSIDQQKFSDYEWLILDNNSEDVEITDFLEELSSRDARVKFFSSPENLHIIGGNKFLLDRAIGRYTITVDHDDLLYSDALALFADVIREDYSNLPSVIYSDEQKISETGQPLNLMWRWRYSLSYAMVTVPAAHLMALDRRKALAADLYTEDYARGSHDWDSILRMTEDGAQVAHVPEVLYGWRVHSGSTAGSLDAKSYIEQSQIAVVEASLRRKDLIHRIAVEPILHGVVGWYKLKRRKGAPMPSFSIDFVWLGELDQLKNLCHNLDSLSTACGERRVLFPKGAEAALKLALGGRNFECVCYEGAAALSAKLSEVSEQTFAKFILNSGVRITFSQAIEDGLTVLETDITAGIIGGPQFSEAGKVTSLGLTAGLEGFLASPFFEWDRRDVPAHITLVTRGVDALPMQFCGVRANLLRTGLSVKGVDTDDALFGMMLCGDLTSRNYNAVLVPGMETVSELCLPRNIVPSVEIREQLVDMFGAEWFKWKLSPHLSRKAADFGKLLLEQSPDTWVETASPGLVVPLNLRISGLLASRPTLNLLLPGVRMVSMSGGPNTAINLVYRLAAAGFAVRLFSTGAPVDADKQPLWDHIASISGVGRRLTNVEIVDACDRSLPIEIGANDVFIATAWWTAQMAHFASIITGGRPFLYLIQDFEPIFYPHSSNYALAVETYNFSHIPIINSSFLRRFLADNKIGKFSDSNFSNGALTFEPAISKTKFYPNRKEDGETLGKRKLLFYARPSAPRNLFEIGVATLKKVIAAGMINGIYWDIIGIGEPFEPIDLGAGTTLQCAPWLSFEDYASLMRSSDLLLSLMLSPHPSYPPLEMAACGGLVVTNAYANKSAEALAEISQNIITAEPTIEALANALHQALLRLSREEEREEAAKINLPSTWDESFSSVFEPLVNNLVALGMRPNPDATQDPAGAGLPAEGDTLNYTRFLKDSAADRARRYPAVPEAGLLSFVTAVWNTPLTFLETLAACVELQTKDMPIEWCIVDNASTRKDVVAFLDRLATEKSYVKLQHSPSNLGIVGGMRQCLSMATGRYIVPLDHDDCIDPDCARVIAWFLQRNDYPPLLYTDEDKVLGALRTAPYLKPTWDPVLFVNSCYISHLCVLDRQIALKLRAYTDESCEGSPDWDIFTRFIINGYLPIHVPEVLYSWRMHENSTASNIDSKPVVYDSQRSVIERWKRAQPAGEKFDLIKSPIFGHSPDWWLRRRRELALVPVTTLFVRTAADQGAQAVPSPVPGTDHEVVEVYARDSLDHITREVRRCAKLGRRVHLMSASAFPDGDEWLFEAAGLFELFPETAVVGGRIHANGVVLGAGYLFSFGDGYICPDRGRPLTDPGYQVQLWKPHTVEAVSSQHTIVDPTFLLETIEKFSGWDPSYQMLGGWLGVHARNTDRRVIYSPFVSATTTVDWECLANLAERSRLNACVRPFRSKPTLWPPHMSAAAGNAYQPERNAQVRSGPPPLPVYADWFSHIPAQDVQGSSVLFSLLTPLYAGSDAELFQGTAASVAAQSYERYEWIIVVQGEISSQLEEILARLVGRDSRAIRIDKDRNAGIMVGTRVAFEAAQGDYILPMDGDDVLVPDALARFTNFIDLSEHRPALIYTDEDILVDGSIQNPYFRPIWDPILDLENSWIWHACAFRRDIAMELDVYQSAGSEYCHDWDTVYRFSKAGHIPAHLRTVAYHWRHHAGSTSGAGAETHSGSSSSVRALLAEKISDKSLEASYVVGPCPIDRGAEEWSIRKRPGSVEGVTRRVKLTSDADWRGRLRASSSVDEVSGAVFITSKTARVIDEELALEEAIKLFSFLPEVGMVSGRLRSDGFIVAAGWSEDDQGDLKAPYDNIAIDNAGAYALAWKPQAISVGVLDCCIVQSDVLCEAIQAAPINCAAQELGFWLGSFLASKNRLVAYSPLVEAELIGEPFGSNNLTDANIIWRQFNRINSVQKRGARGAAGRVDQFRT